ncbi:MAG: hypothetical protein ACOYNG_02680 [Terrimicrobiaceae bacterium]
MNPPPSKSTKDIMVSETKTFLGGDAVKQPDPIIVPLADKIDEYVLKLGYSNAHVLGVLVQLLTLGKVRVDFRDYSERLQLLNLNDRMARTEAVELFDRHMLAMSRNDEPVSLMATQKIVVQAPKVNLPRVR